MAIESFDIGLAALQRALPAVLVPGGRAIGAAAARSHGLGGAGVRLLRKPVSATARGGRDGPGGGHDPEELVDVVAAHLVIAPDRKQELLEGEERREAAAAAAGDPHPGERVHRHRERDLRPRARQLRTAAAQGLSARAAQGPADELGEEADEESEQGPTSSSWQRRSCPKPRRRALTKEIKRLGDLPPLLGRGGRGQDLSGHGPGPPWGVAVRRGSCPTWPLWRGCSTRRTTAWRTSRTASSSIWRSPGCGRHAAEHHAVPGGSSRGRQDLGGHGHRARAWTGRCSASAWAACATRPRSAGTEAPTWAPCRAASSTR